MRSTTSASSRPVPGCQPLRTRMNSPPPLARSSEKIAVGLEEPKPANPLPGHPGGRRQCHRAVGKFHPGIGQIQMGGEHRDPRCSDLGGHAAARQVKHEVKIVNHQIEHHGYVGAPRLEGSQSLTLDVPGTVQERLRRPECPVVPLDVPDLQLKTPAPGGRDQTVGFLQRRRERFLHQNRNPELQGTKAHLRVYRCRDGDRDCLDPGQQVIHLHEGRRSQLSRDFRRATGVDVANPNQTNLVQPGQVPGMMLAQRSYADDANWKSWFHAGTPRSLDSTKARNRSTSGNGGRSLRARSIAWERLRSELKKSR